MVNNTQDALVQAIAELRADMARRFVAVEERLGRIKQLSRKEPRNDPPPRRQNENEYGEETWNANGFTCSDVEDEPSEEEQEPEPPDRERIIKDYHHIESYINSEDDDESIDDPENEPTEEGREQEHAKDSEENYTKSFAEQQSWCKEPEDNHDEELDGETDSQMNLFESEPCDSLTCEEDFGPEYISFSGHSEGPKAYIRWEEAMEDWFQSNQVPEAEKTAIAEDTLIKEAIGYWDELDLYNDGPDFTWEEMKEIMHEEFVDGATTNSQYEAMDPVPRRLLLWPNPKMIIKACCPKSKDVLIHHLKGNVKERFTTECHQQHVPTHQTPAETNIPTHAPLREPQVSSVEHKRNYLSGNQTDVFMTPKLSGVVARDHERVYDFFHLKVEPPDAPHITKPSPYQGKTLASQNRVKANLLSLGTCCTISRTKFLEGGGYDADIKPLTSTTHHGVNMTVVEYMAKYTKDKGETNFLGEHIKDKGETIFGDVFQLPGLNDKSNIKIPPVSPFRLDVCRESSTISPEKTYAPRIARTKCEIFSTNLSTTGKTLLVQLELTSKWNQPKINLHVEDMAGTKRTDPNLPDLDRCAFKRDLRADQDEPNNEATCFGNLMLNGRSGSWNHVNIFSESEDMIFTTQVNLNSPSLDLRALFGTSRSNQRELGCKPTWYGILIQKQNSKNWNHTEPVLDVKVIQFLTQRFVGLLHLDVPELGTSQSHVWRPGDIQAFLRSLLRYT